MKLSVVIPAYNEEKDIKAALHDVYRVLPDAEIIVVNDCSTDATTGKIQEFVTETGKMVNVGTNLVNQGHGRSVVTGLKQATGDHILYIDADRQIDLENFKRIPEENFFLFDVISGWRIQRSDKLFRKITSFCLKMTILLRHGYFIKDANCPFKIYRKAALLTIIDKLPDTHIIPIACLEVLARKEGLFTAILDTPHKPYDGTREGFLQIPNIRFFKFVWNAFKEVVRL